MIRVEHGDCLEVLPTLAADSVSAVVTDPPYHLTSIVKRFGGKGAAPAKHGTDGAFARAAKGFMGKTWDGGDVAFRPETWAAVLRVMKPGAYLFAFASTRGCFRMGVAIEDAGFIMHPFVAWLFATGFPKAHKVESEEWAGWRYGLQSLKPAIEPILLAQKPMSEKTGTANVLRHGTGAVNIDACKIGTGEKLGGGGNTTPVAEGWDRPYRHDPTAIEDHKRRTAEKVAKAEALGRWPANVAHDGSEEVLAAFAAYGGSSSRKGSRRESKAPGDGWGMTKTGAEYDDSGSAARFFFSAKAGAEDRWGSRHPTVKPVALIRWLVRLITPPGGVVLDPFAGSGTTGVACLAEGHDFILIEREAEYVADINARLDYYRGDGRHALNEKARRSDRKDAGPLFWGAP